MSIIRVAITLGLVTYIFSFTQLLYGKFKEWKVYNYNFPSATDKNFYISIECCDIDMDGDFDLFVGNWKGFIAFYENIGNPDKFLFKLVNNGLSKESSFYKVFVGNKAIPRLVDIDADNDFDLFVGNNNGNIAFYRNDGDMNHPLFKLIREGTEQINSYFNINVGFAAAPFFVDIDNDNDYDLFIGNAQGYIAFYRNDGTSTSPLFTRVKGGFSIQDSFENINTEGYSIPVFCDINNDGKYDLFVGNWDGTIYYYKNIGSEKLPKYKLISKKFGNINVGGDSSPFFVDLNNDGFDEIIIGNNEGKIRIYNSLEGKKLLVYQPTPKTHIAKAKSADKKNKEKIDINKIYFNRIKELYEQKDYIEALNVINKIENKTDQIEDLEKCCEIKLKDLYNRLSKESFLFKEVENNFKKAVDKYINGKYKSAIDYFKKVLNNIPNHKISLKYKKRAEKKMKEQEQEAEAKKMYEIALKNYKNGDIEKAFIAIKKAKEKNPNNLKYQGIFSKFSNEYYLKMDKVFYQTNIAKAKIFMDSKKYESAATVLYQIKEKFPDNKEVNNMLKICEKKIADLKSKYNKKLKEKYLNEGDKYFNMFNYEKALRNYNLALKYAPDDEEIKKKIKLAQANIKKKEKRALNPEAVKKHLQQGLKYYSLGQYEKAIFEWNKVLEIDPKNKIAKKNIEKAKKKLNK